MIMGRITTSGYASEAVSAHANRPDTKGLFSIIALCYNASGNMPKNIKYLMIFLTLFAGILLPLFGALAETDDNQGDYADYKKSPYTHPSWDTFVEEGFKAFANGDMVSAVEFLKKTMSLGCQSPLVYFKLALIYESQHSYYSSLQYYELARDEFLKNPTKHRYKEQFEENYGRALYMSGDEEKALPILERAGRKSQNFWILRLLGQRAMNAGDLLKATGYYEQASQLNDPALTSQELVNMYTELARGYQAQNENSATQRYYEKILSIDPSNREAKDYMDRIKKRENEEKAFDIFNKH